MDTTCLESFSCLILSVFVILCLPLSATSHFPSQNATVYLGSSFIQEALRRARELTDAAYAHTNERVKTSVSDGSVRPSDLLALFKQTGPKTRSHITSAEFLDNTVELIREMVYTHSMDKPDLTELLSAEDMETILQVTGCSSETLRHESFSCLILSVFVILCLPLSATSHFPSQNATVYLGSSFIQEALRRARELTDAAYAHTNERVKTSVSDGSVRPSDLLALFKQTGPKTRSHITSAEFLDNTVELIREMVYTHSMDKPDLTELLSAEDMETILQVTGCSSETLRHVCKSDCVSKRYRTITGHCNNRENPQWGAANTPYARWLSPEYEDPRGAPRGWNPQHTYHNHTLPPVRVQDSLRNTDGGLIISL
ncbi:eosinophil peroxidase-like [Sinocyclocheilus anshuiensis]|uniref:eosinophil peroxidase-like n=1 Tax=Sinocyclocheilus anshuiensis TaxID=1608454 RepID=UPI0007B80B28|nr:PREDICTED: eosinophil peroxidase-like [Sinocyclocheilus anshuiensis]